MRLVLFFLLWSTCFAVSTCEGQSYYFKQYQADDGLAHNSVNTVMQDQKGMIWVGTRGGLNRFDGYTFKTFKNEKSRFGNIGNNIIVSLAEDKKGMLWVGTGRGILKYDPVKEVFTPLAPSMKKYINSILVDYQNNLFFLANRVLFKYIQKDNRVIDLRISASCIAIDEHRNILVGNDNGELLTYNPQTGSKTSVKIIGQNVPANLRSISKIFPTGNNNLLVGCFKKGLKSYNTKTGAIKSLILKNNDNTDIYVRDITAGENQEYWIATESGIYIYNLATNVNINLRKRPGDPYAITDNAVYTVCKDNQGGMWAGTYFGGLSYFSKKMHALKNIIPCWAPIPFQEMP